MEFEITLQILFNWDFGILNGCINYIQVLWKVLWTIKLLSQKLMIVKN